MISGFPYPSVDPLGFLVDEEIRPFEIDIRHDLTGAGAQACPMQSTGLFIIHEHTVPANTVEVVHNVFPHLWQRTNAGNLTLESVSLLNPQLYAGFVLFDNSKDGNQPFLVEHNYNAPYALATPNDKDRKSLRGRTLMSSDAPMMQNIGMRNPLAMFHLPAGSRFRVLFSLAPLAATGGIPNPWTIGADDQAPGQNYIDFAGALVTGVRMPAQLYNKLQIARRKGQLGPEGSSAEDPIGVKKGKKDKAGT